MCSGLPVRRNCTAASKVEGEQRLSDSRRALSSSGVNGFTGKGKGFVLLLLLEGELEAVSGIG
jgi:hypothetical protein